MLRSTVRAVRNARSGSSGLSPVAVIYLLLLHVVVKFALDNAEPGSMASPALPVTRSAIFASIDYNHGGVRGAKWVVALSIICLPSRGVAVLSVRRQCQWHHVIGIVADCSRITRS